MRITGGTHKGRRFRSTWSAGLRPTSERVRGAIFSLIGSDAVKGKRVLDLYSGTGALGIEALSRGAAWADFVELSGARVRQLRDTLCQLSMNNRINIYRAKVEKIIGSLPRQYDLVLADPPYTLDAWDQLMNNLSKSDLIKENGVVVLEYPHRVNLKEKYDLLGLVKNRRYGDTAVSVYRAVSLELA